MKAYWQARSLRERRILLAGGALLLAVLLWVLALEPLVLAGRKAERALPELRRQAAELRHLANQADRLKTRAATAVGRPDVAGLTASATAAGLSAPRVVALSGGGFSVRLERAPFGALHDWLVRLQVEQRLFVSTARIQATGEGTVQAELVLAP